MSDDVVVVLGLGEVGAPLYEVLQQRYECVGVDIDPVNAMRPCSVMHICLPYQIADFVGATSEYIAKYKPEITVINSTVAPGTTQAIAKRSRSRVAYSPVRGKHARMRSDMMRYRKFVGADDAATRDAVIAHFSNAGFTTARFRSSAVGEVAKLLETTWLGVLVGWAQEAERIGREHGASYDEINAFLEEIDFLPRHITPGFIGGHCVMPNVEILRGMCPSEFLDAIVQSNDRKAAEEQAASRIEVNS